MQAVSNYDLEHAQKLKNSANRLINNNGDLSQAADLLDLAIRFCPPEETLEVALYHNMKGVALYNVAIGINGQKAALVEFTKALEFNPKYLMARRNVMAIHRNLKHYD